VVLRHVREGGRGLDWVVSEDGDEICLDISEVDEGSATCSAHNALLQLSTSEATVLGGYVPPCVVAVEYAPTGERSQGDQLYATPTPEGGWAIVVSGDVSGEARTYLLDEDGDVVATLIGRGETVTC
jgi:hypothetical protein